MKLELKTIQGINKFIIAQTEHLSIPPDETHEVLGWYQENNSRYVILHRDGLLKKMCFYCRIPDVAENVYTSCGEDYVNYSVGINSPTTYNYPLYVDRDFDKVTKVHEGLVKIMEEAKLKGQFYLYE